MDLSENDRRKRLILSTLMIDILKPSCEAIAASANERLLAYCVAVSSFGPHRMGLNKLAETSGLARTTVRRTLEKLVARGWAKKTPEGAFVIHPEYALPAAAEWELDDKYRMIMDAAEALRKCGDL